MEQAGYLTDTSHSDLLQVAYCYSGTQEQ